MLDIGLYYKLNLRELNHIQFQDGTAIDTAMRFICEHIEAETKLSPFRTLF